MEFSNLRVYQPDGTFKTGGLSISGDRIASAEVSADAVDVTNCLTSGQPMLSVFP